MAQWNCPKCEGGFPEPSTSVVGDPDDPNTDTTVCEQCPWCGQTIGGFRAELNKVFSK